MDYEKDSESESKFISDILEIWEAELQAIHKLIEDQ